MHCLTGMTIVHEKIKIWILTPMDGGNAKELSGTILAKFPQE